jgi:hypothetical protein
MAMRVKGGRMVETDFETRTNINDAAGKIEKAAADVSQSVNRLKRFAADNPKLNQLINEGDQLRERIWALAQKIKKA